MIGEGKDLQLHGSCCKLACPSQMARGQVREPQTHNLNQRKGASAGTCSPLSASTWDNASKCVQLGAEALSWTAGLTQTGRAAVRLGEVVRGGVAAAVEQHEDALRAGHSLPDNLHALHCLQNVQALAEGALADSSDSGGPCWLVARQTCTDSLHTLKQSVRNRARQCPNLAMQTKTHPYRPAMLVCADVGAAQTCTGGLPTLNQTGCKGVRQGSTLAEEVLLKQGSGSRLVTITCTSGDHKGGRSGAQGHHGRCKANWVS